MSRSDITHSTHRSEITRNRLQLSLGLPLVNRLASVSWFTRVNAACRHTFTNIEGSCPKAATAVFRELGDTCSDNY